MAAALRLAGSIRAQWAVELALEVAIGLAQLLGLKIADESCQRRGKWVNRKSAHPGHTGYMRYMGYTGYTGYVQSKGVYGVYA